VATPETEPLAIFARYRGLLASLGADPAETRLAGWGGSTDRAGLSTISLQTGNFAGNFDEIPPAMANSPSFGAANQRVRATFPIP